MKEGSNRRFILIEIDPENAERLIALRMRKVIDGCSKAQLDQHGGGFRFYRLGARAFDEEGRICPDISFPVLAAHIWFSESGAPWSGIGTSPALGIHNGAAYALLYNGILGNKRPDGGNVLTSKTLKIIRQELDKIKKDFTGPLVVYGESSRIGEARLKRENVVFKQTPYDIKAR